VRDQASNHRQQAGSLGYRLFFFRPSIHYTHLRVRFSQKFSTDSTGDGGGLLKFAHLTGNTSSTLVCVTPPWSPMKRAGNLATKATGKKVSLGWTPQVQSEA
jgi:hypothetical protein